MGDVLSKKDERTVETKEKGEVSSMDFYCDFLELAHLRDRNIGDLSGGELQRFSIATLCVQVADVYMFDEPSSYLDVKQRMAAAHAIRGLQAVNNFLIVVEHDLAVLDYLSDYVCCLWGTAGAYGVVTMPFSVREGINIFLDGFVPTENLRFREVSLTFKVSADDEIEVKERMHNTVYPYVKKTMKSEGSDKKFLLEVEEGTY